MKRDRQYRSVIPKTGSIKIIPIAMSRIPARISTVRVCCCMDMAILVLPSPVTNAIARYGIEIPMERKTNIKIMLNRFDWTPKMIGMATIAEKAQGAAMNE